MSLLDCGLFDPKSPAGKNRPNLCENIHTHPVTHSLVNYNKKAPLCCSDKKGDVLGEIFFVIGNMNLMLLLASVCCYSLLYKHVYRGLPKAQKPIGQRTAF